MSATIAQLDRLAGDGAAHAPAWLRRARREAKERFAARGWPTMGDEEWRFTSFKPIATTPFTSAEPLDAPIHADALPAILSDGAPAARLVFVNGHYRPDLSRRDALPAGVHVTSLADTIRRAPEVIEPHLTQYATDPDDPFASLNTALFADGALVRIEAGVQSRTPIHVILLTAPADAPQASFPRVLILAERGAAATVVEYHGSLADGIHWTNAVTEIVLGDAAEVDHYFLESASEQAFHTSALRVAQGRASRLEAHPALLGGALVRSNVHVELQGQDCHSLVNGLFLGRGRQHLDNHMRVVHARPGGASRQFYRGILADQAHGVFTGRILVRPGAQKTDAKQTNRNLLLSEEARINTQPQLEIYADDVKCTHGATTGRLDEQALFYLQSRGISEQAARGLLIYAFARESLGRMRLAPLRAWLEARLVSRLPQPELLAGLIETAEALETSQALEATA